MPANVVAIAARRTVDVRLAGDALAVEGATRVLRERLGGEGLEVSFDVEDRIDPERVLGPELDVPGRASLARVWVDLSGEERLTVYVVDASGDRVLVRDVVRHDNPEVAWEGVGHIVELAIGALRAGERIGVGRDEARAQLLPDVAEPASPAAIAAPPPAERDVAEALPPPAPAPRTRARAGLFYEAQVVGSGPEPATGPGAMLELRRRVGRHSVGGLVTGQYRFPNRVDGDEAQVRLEGGAFRLMASGALALTSTSELALDLGPGLDVVSAEAIAPATVRVAPRTTEWVPVVRALVRYTLATRHARLFAGLGVDVPAQNPRYVLARGSELAVVFEPWAVRPFVLMGVALP